jgi:flagellar hook-associated protein 1 FlgK
MTTFNSITSIATSGLSAAQTGIAATSDNITNVDTTGYVREVVNQSSASNQGQLSGVNVDGVTLAVNRYLENASYSASADVGQAQAVSSLLTQAQSLLGDPSASTGYFNQFGDVLSAFSAAANDPSSSLSATEAVNQVSQFLNQSQSVSSSIGALSTQADTSISSDVTQVNQLLSQISSLNSSITNATAAGNNASPAQDAQNSLITQLSSLIDVKVTSTSGGGVSLTNQSGQALVGYYGAATLSYTPSTSAPSQVTIVQPGAGQSQTLQIQSGAIQGLLTLRNTTLPGVQDQLSEYVTQAVNAINQASNASSTVPAPQTLTGQPVSTDITTALTGFTGTTNVAVVNSSGVVQQQVAIDFTNGTITPSGGSAISFTPANFVTQLNSALGGAATVSVTNNNTLSISATTTGNGVAIADSSTDPSQKSGEGFSQYFGLNNLITTSGVTNYATGLTTSSTNGFTGGTLTVALTNSSGNLITNVPITIPSGGTIQDVLNSLNASNGGVGLYGQFSLNSSGELSFASTTTAGATVSVVSDTSQWGSNGASISQLFGIGDEGLSSRINGFSVNANIAAQPSTIPFAQLNLSAASGVAALVPGDGSGAQALANAGSTTQTFDTVAGLAGGKTTVNQYAAQLAGLLGEQSSAATSAVTNATAVQTEAQSRQQSAEGVNLDQELVNLTTYQQAYSASSRLITATTDMFTALMDM